METHDSTVKNNTIDDPLDVPIALQKKQIRNALTRHGLSLYYIGVKLLPQNSFIMGRQNLTKSLQLYGFETNLRYQHLWVLNKNNIFPLFTFIITNKSS